MEQGTEIVNVDSMDAIVAAFNNDDMEAFMEASGQRMVKPYLVARGRCISTVDLSMRKR